MTGPGQLERLPDPPRLPPRAATALDVTVAASVAAVGVVGTMARLAGAAARPAVGVLLRPPLIAPAYQPAAWLEQVARSGGRRRAELVREVSGALDLIVPAIAAAVIQRLDLTEIVRTQVDLDGVVASVDVDAVAQRLDIDAVVARLDFNEIVKQRVDLDALVATVDLDAVANRLNIDAIIERIDLVGLAEDVIAEIDLPEIIRASTGSMASETMRGVRLQSVSADDAIARAVDRFRLRRSRRTSDGGSSGDR